MTKRGKRPSFSTVMLGSLAAFMAILAFLAFQVRAGHDPALSRPAQVAQIQQHQPRRVIVRRVEDDYVITKVVPAPSQGTTSVQPALTSGTSGGAGASAAPAPAPVVTSSPVPAPAPTPAPVTRTS